MKLLPPTTALVFLCMSNAAFGNCDFDSTSAQTIRGSVYEDQNNNERRDRFEPGIAAVSISNGCDVVLSDPGGNYQISIHPTQILFFSKPTGYRVKVDEHNVPQFFYRHYPNGTPTEIAGTAVEWAWPVIASTGELPSFINFGLLPNPEASNTFKAHAFADTQARFDLGEDMVREDLVTPLISNPYEVEFGLTVGDVVYDNLALYERHKRMMSLMDIPQWYLPGNHDINFNSPDGIFANETFKRHFGPTYYSFNEGAVHFVVLNNVDYAGKDQRYGNSTYRGYIPEDQLNWLEQDLTTVDKEKLIVIATHIPLVTEANDGINEPLTGPGTQNFDRLLSILAPFSNIYGLAGHDTSNSWKVEVDHEHGWQGRPWIAHTLAEVRGSGWTRGREDARGVKDAIMDDGNPNGFYILKFDDVTLVPDFVPFPYGADAAQNLRIALDPPLSTLEGGSISRGQLSPNTHLVVNLFDGGARDKVWATLDSGERQSMAYSIRIDPTVAALNKKYEASEEAYNEPAKSAHIWELKLPTDLDPGLHLITVESQDEFGQQRSRSYTFEVIAD